MKKYIKETTEYMPTEEVEKIVEEIENEPFETKNFVKRKPLINEEDEIIVVTDNFEQLKSELREEIINQGYKSVSDFAKKNHGRYKQGTIKMNLARNNRHSESVLAYITKKLGLKFSKKVTYELKK